MRSFTSADSRIVFSSQSLVTSSCKISFVYCRYVYLRDFNISIAVYNREGKLSVLNKFRYRCAVGRIWLFTTCW